MFCLTISTVLSASAGSSPLMLEQYSAPITADARPDTRVSFGTGCHEPNPRRFWPSAQPGCTGDTVKLPHALSTAAIDQTERYSFGVRSPEGAVFAGGPWGDHR